MLPRRTTPCLEGGKRFFAMHGTHCWNLLVWEGWRDQLEPWGKWKVETELDFMVTVASLWAMVVHVPLYATQSQEVHRWEEPLISYYQMVYCSHILFHTEYLSYALFSNIKKSWLKTHFIYGPFSLSKKTKPRNVNAVSVWPQIMVGSFGKVPGRLFLEEKHQHFSCGTLIGNRIVVQPRQEIKMKWAGVFILVP